MIREIFNSYRFFNVKVKARFIMLFDYIFFNVAGTIIFLPILKEKIYFVMEILSIILIYYYIINPIELFRDDNKEYKKFVKSIPSAYKRLKNTIIINIFVAIICYCIYYAVSGVMLSIVIKGYPFSFYIFIYLLLIGLVLSVVTIIPMIVLKEGIIYHFNGAIPTAFYLGFGSKFVEGFYAPQVWYTFFGQSNSIGFEKFKIFVEAPDTILAFIFATVLFIFITYFIALILIKKRWKP